MSGSLEGREVLITLVLVALLGAVFLKGFKEAIGVAVIIVGAYLLLNLVVVAVGLYDASPTPSASPTGRRRCSPATATR